MLRASWSPLGHDTSTRSPRTGPLRAPAAEPPPSSGVRRSADRSELSSIHPRISHTPRRATVAESVGQGWWRLIDHDGARHTARKDQRARERRSLGLYQRALARSCRCCHHNCICPTIYCLGLAMALPVDGRHRPPSTCGILCEPACVSNPRSRSVRSTAAAAATTTAGGDRAADEAGGAAHLAVLQPETLPSRRHSRLLVHCGPRESGH
jgi:hypothetical protein